MNYLHYHNWAPFSNFAIAFLLKTFFNLFLNLTGVGQKKNCPLPTKDISIILKALCQKRKNLPIFVTNTFMEIPLIFTNKIIYKKNLQGTIGRHLIISP